MTKQEQKSNALLLVKDFSSKAMYVATAHAIGHGPTVKAITEAHEYAMARLLTCIDDLIDKQPGYSPETQACIDRWYKREAERLRKKEVLNVRKKGQR